MLAAVDPPDLDEGGRRVHGLALRDFRRAGVDQDEDGPRPGCASSPSGRPRSPRSSPRTSATASARSSVDPARSTGCRRTSSTRHPAGEDGQVVDHHRLPRLPAVLDLLPRPGRRGRRSCSVPQPRLAGERRPAPRAARAAPRARHAARLRRLAVLRRRGQDDRQGRGDPGVRRPDHRRLRGGRPPRLRRAAGARCSRTTPSVDRRSTASTSCSTPRCCAASSSTSTPSRSGAYFDFTQGARRAARRDRPALRRRVRRGHRRPDLARGRGDVRRAARTARGSAGSTSTCTRARASTATPRSSTSPPGIAGRQLAEGVLVCNFSRGLMEHDHVVTLFHEFGHLVHHVLAGGHAWARFSGVATEWDFVEAPSPDARGVGVGRRRAAVVRDQRRRRADPARRWSRKMRARRRVRQGALRAHPDVLRRAVLQAAPGRARRHHRHDARAPGDVRRLRATSRTRHFFAASGTSRATASGYYTYMWSLVIAKDLFSAFDPDDLFATEVAHRYRDRVLAAGRQQGRRRPGRGLPRPALRLRVVPGLAGPGLMRRAGALASVTAVLLACLAASPAPAVSAPAHRPAHAAAAGHPRPPPSGTASTRRSATPSATASRCPDAPGRRRGVPSSAGSRSRNRTPRRSRRGRSGCPRRWG